MKKLFVIFCLMISTLASAESILVYEGEGARAFDYSAEFSINKKLGRAWITVTETRPGIDGSDYIDTRVLVPGLSYDVEAKQVIFTKGNEKIVCGELYNKPWVIDVGGSIRTTERCLIGVKNSKIQVDDGFEIKTRRVVQVTLTIE